MEAAVGHRLPDVRVRRRGPALGRRAPPVHVAQGRRRGLARNRPGPLCREGLRRGAQRHRARRRFGADPSRGRAEQGVPRAEDQRRGSAAEVRLPAGRAAVRRTAARRHRRRPGPLRDADGRRRVVARRDRVPQDAARPGPAHAGAGSGGRQAAARAAYPAADDAGGVTHKIPHSVLVVIHTPGLQVLLVNRADMPDYWQSVTGAKDFADEPLDVTARREVMEETGIDCAIGTLADWNIENVYDIYPRWLHRYEAGVTRNT